ncbi:hypothetical protein GFH48_03860 [Streptomyces fagopyri]|uniref:Uncharacterized protein n=1 Tax=Streptomyces fagopyri TaxID=2662397 RepID=A0A5Q0L665_9ACTN|nr:hypothetical protein [Streptomyces fagopyri]QFZ72512.1 hypothetical protein GFH48_03860 [Streptomyces fagopyri]
MAAPDLPSGRPRLAETGRRPPHPPHVLSGSVLLSIGTRNRDVQDDWPRATGPSLGPAQTGWQ